LLLPQLFQGQSSVALEHFQQPSSHAVAFLDASSFVIASIRSGKFHLMYAIITFYSNILHDFPHQSFKNCTISVKKCLNNFLNSFKVLTIIFNCLKSCIPETQDRLWWQWGGWKFFPLTI
jgi:hypothetical protein